MDFDKPKVYGDTFISDGLVEIVDDVVVDDDNGGVGYNFDNDHHLTVGSSVSIISLRCPEIVLFSSGPDS